VDADADAGRARTQSAAAGFDRADSLSRCIIKVDLFMAPSVRSCNFQAIILPTLVFLMLIDSF